MIGIDEVGRGCWAGPLLVVAARQTDELPLNLDDSKKLSPLKRQSYIDGIRRSCALGEGWVTPAEIDRHGLTEAMKLAVQRALHAIAAKDDEKIIMDGAINYCDINFSNVTCAPKADALYPVVSAASIYAKVTRDQFMTDIAPQYPGYGFESHVGYGTKQHQEALSTFGVSALHRRSFRPIAMLLAT